MQNLALSQQAATSRGTSTAKDCGNGSCTGILDFTESDSVKLFIISEAVLLPLS